MIAALRLIGLGLVVALGLSPWWWVPFVPLGGLVVSLFTFICWHVFGPERERAHTRYVSRRSTRPRPASAWAVDDSPIAPPVLPTRPDIVPRPGRRMVALLDDDLAKQAPQ